MPHPATALSSDPTTRYFEESFWREHFPALTISEATYQKHPQWADHAMLDARIARDGYYHGSEASLKKLAPLLAETVKHFIDRRIPPPFLFIFDEAWAAFSALDGMLSHLLGDQYRIMPDFWVWHLDPQKQEAGWGPHRDKGRRSLAADGTPLSMTVWVPLTDATPLNGCMYMLPASLDPNYNTENELDITCQMPHIRALPALAGEFLCWNQAVRHWGGQASPFAPEPRISMAFEFQRVDIPAFNTPLLDPRALPAFKWRLKLIAKQILQYKHMYALDPEMEAFAKRVIAGKG